MLRMYKLGKVGREQSAEKSMCRSAVRSAQVDGELGSIVAAQNKASLRVQEHQGRCGNDHKQKRGHEHRLQRLSTTSTLGVEQPLVSRLFAFRFHSSM